MKGKFKLIVATCLSLAAGCASRPVSLTFEFEGLPNQTVDVLVTEEFGEGLEVTVFTTALWTIPPGKTLIEYDACLPLGMRTLDRRGYTIEPEDVAVPDAKGRARVEIDVSKLEKNPSSVPRTGALPGSEADRWNALAGSARDFQDALAQEGGRQKIGCTFPKSFDAIHYKR